LYKKDDTNEETTCGKSHEKKTKQIVFLLFLQSHQWMFVWKNDEESPLL